MKAIKYYLIIFLLVNCGLAQAQTNAPAGMPVEQEVVITADSSHFDGITNQLVYLGHVVVLDPPRSRLECERLTVFLPADHGNPTNIVAETNVIVDYVDESGQTNHVTAPKGIYTYQLLDPITNIVNSATNITYGTTNEIITFATYAGELPWPKVTTPKGTVRADPLIVNVPKRTFDTPGKVEYEFKRPAGLMGGTNAFKP
jgi:lipopolysaccharide export system protein LptA